MPSEIEREFHEVYGLLQRDYTRQVFLSRVVEKVNKTTDDNWERLTADAQRWFNTALKAWDSEKNIPDFPDTEENPEPEHEEEPAEEAHEAESSAADDEREDDMTTRKKKKARTAAKPPAKKRVVATNGTSKLANSGGLFLKKAMLRKMTSTDDELSKILKDKDFPLSPVRISIIRNEFRHTMRLLQEEGKLKDTYKF